MLNFIRSIRILHFQWKFRIELPRAPSAHQWSCAYSSIINTTGPDPIGKGSVLNEPSMKNYHRIALLSLALFTVLPLQAQIGGIEDSVADISDTIRAIFPIILGVIFLIGFLFNAGHFFGENADMKKGITRVLVFVLIAGAVVGIFTYLITLVV